MSSLFEKFIETMDHILPHWIWDDFMAKKDEVEHVFNHFVSAELASKDAEIERLRSERDEVSRLLFEYSDMADDAGFGTHWAKSLIKSRKLVAPPTAEGHADNIQTKGSE